MFKYFLIFTMILTTGFVFAKPTSGVPAKLQVALILKLLPFNKNLSGDISIHVINAPEVASELKAAIGKSFGSFKLAKVTEGDNPEAGSKVVYINDSKGVSNGTSFSKKNKATTVTGDPDLASSGISLGIGLEDGKPKVLLNLSASKDEGIDWNPAILKIASTL